jgi:hypothetical protein
MRSGLAKRAMGVLACGAMLAGCGGEDAPEAGVLVVPFELGNQRDCSDLGVVAVRAEIDGGERSEEADCEAGNVRFDLLMPDSYEVALYGIDLDGVAIMDSLETGPHVMHVVGDGTTVVADPALKLTASPAKLKLRWDFGFGTCDSAGVASFAITAWRADGSKLLLDTEIPCDMEGEGREQYRTVPDLDRDLSGDEVGEVGVQPYDVNGLPLGDPMTFIFDAPGAGRSVQLSIACDGGGCEGSGRPD